MVSLAVIAARVVSNVKGICASWNTRCIIPQKGGLVVGRCEGEGDVVHGASACEGGGGWLLALATLFRQADVISEAEYRYS